MTRFFLFIDKKPITNLLCEGDDLWSRIYERVGADYYSPSDFETVVEEVTGDRGALRRIKWEL